MHSRQEWVDQARLWLQVTVVFGAAASGAYAASRADLLRRLARALDSAKGASLQGVQASAALLCLLDRFPQPFLRRWLFNCQSSASGLGW